MEEKFKVEGMTCASCQAHVNNAVSKLVGVKKVNVSLIEKNMVVEFDENQVDENQIEQAVSKAGYKATVFKDEPYQKVIDEQKKAIKKKRNKLIVSLIFLVLLMVVAMGHMIAMEFNKTFISNDPLVLIPIQIVLLIPIIILNFNYFTSGFKALFNLSPNMDSLIAIGSLASIIYGLYAFIYIIVLHIQDPNMNMHLIHQLGDKLYFESAGTILGLVSLGKYFESKSLNSTMASIYKLMSLAPDKATVIINGKQKVLNINQIKINDQIVIKAGDKIPLDGTIISGYGNIDESSITGESLPVFKKENDKVISGTINKNGSFIFKAEKIGKDTTLNKIIELVKEASSSKAKIAKLVDKIAFYFVPVVILLSIITFISWIFISHYNFDLSFNFAISVLVISCPCALGLATPVAIMVGTGKGASNGILIKQAQGFENLASVDTIVLDKTGTITSNQMKVVDFNLPKEDLNNLASLENKSTHPLSLALVRYAKDNLFTEQEVTNYKYYPGLGLSGTISNHNYLSGNLDFTKKYVDEKAIKEIEKYTLEGKTVIFVIKDDKFLGYYTVSDSLKESSKKAIYELKKLNKEVILLTGDNKNTANYIARQVGIDKVIANVKPEGKLEEIKKLQAQNKKVCMVGDGINDSPSLIQADVGMAIGAGSDIAIDSADIILIRSDLLDVVSSILLSKKVVRTIKMNLFWAFFYNAITIPLAAGVLYFNPIYVQLNPMIASLCMALSSVTVVLNALTLNFFKRQEIKDTKKGK